MSKQPKSKLDQYAAQLADMDQAVPRQTLEEITAWLAQEGCSVSLSTVGRYLESLRSQRRQAKVLADITSASNQCKAVEKLFGENPAPGLETIIKLIRVSIMQQATHAQDNPELLKLVDQLTNTVIQHVSAQTKAAQKERELRLAEDKFQVTVCEKFLEWFKDAKAREIADSSVGNAEKIAQLRLEYFKDVDALQKSGKVVLPQ